MKDRPGHDFRYALNNKKVLRKLKWRNKISFEDGLRDTVKWYLINKSFINQIKEKNTKKD